MDDAIGKAQSYELSSTHLKHPNLVGLAAYNIDSRHPMTTTL